VLQKAGAILEFTRKDAVKNISTQIVQIPNGITSTVRLAVRNTGDIPIWDLTVNVFPGLQSALGINGLNPAAITSPNIPQTLLSTILPIGIVGPSFFGIGELPANTNKEFDVRVFPTHFVAGTVELMNFNLVYNNILGERAYSLLLLCNTKSIVFAFITAIHNNINSLTIVPKQGPMCGLSLQLSLK
jgi:hypothetical protein